MSQYTYLTQWSIVYFNKIILFFISLLLFLPLSTEAQLRWNWFENQRVHPKEAAAKLYRSADKEYQKGKLNKAVKYLKKAIDLDPTNSIYINKIADIYNEQKKFTKALNYLERKRKLIQDTCKMVAIHLSIGFAKFSQCYPR